MDRSVIPHIIGWYDLDHHTLRASVRAQTKEDAIQAAKSYFQQRRIVFEAKSGVDRYDVIVIPEYKEL